MHPCTACVRSIRFQKMILLKMFDRLPLFYRLYYVDSCYSVLIAGFIYSIWSICPTLSTRCSLHSLLHPLYFLDTLYNPSTLSESMLSTLLVLILLCCLYSIYSTCLIYNFESIYSVPIGLATLSYLASQSTPSTRSAPCAPLCPMSRYTPPHFI